MEMLTKMRDDELQDINGGSISLLTILEVVGLIGGLYAIAREVARDAGENAAYRDLGM